MTTKKNGFAKGSGCYTCGSCGKKTRSVGHGDCEHVRLCVACYDAAGLENAHQDGHHRETLDPECPACFSELPVPVLTESRICFGVAYFASEKEAEIYAKHVAADGRTYNGGFFHGMACGRDRGYDYLDENGRKLYAVTE